MIDTEVEELTDTQKDRLYRTRCAPPWRGEGVWPGQELPNAAQVVHVVGCRAGQRINVLGCDPLYCAEAKPDHLNVRGYEWALAYVEKTGGPDAWRFRAPVQWRRRIAAAQQLPTNEDV